ncbi:hypothetical protein [Halolamina salifodinae]|uniref:Uncharacterized protein n=1 Tax=Halolamina salifodinae TaxID=1202767 RepID=A0A8T4H1L3_9EURY|nr:hypothetical protein [Halolamina salifodinae]MBP1987674.1 hypothetical protein [Halolamina salifodinae]
MNRRDIIKVTTPTVLGMSGCLSRGGESFPELGGMKVWNRRESKQKFTYILKGKDNETIHKDEITVEGADPSANSTGYKHISPDIEESREISEVVVQGSSQTNKSRLSFDDLDEYKCVEITIMIEESIEILVKRGCEG